MPTRSIKILPDSDDVAQAATELLLATLDESLARSGRCFVLLSGGTTPRAMYRLLKTKHRDRADDLGRADYFVGDEREVSWDSPQSNTGEAFREFLDPLGVAQGRRHVPTGAPPDFEREAVRLTRELETTVPKGPTGAPHFDIAFLGVGTDGHTASLFPGTAALALTESCYAINDVPQLNTRRLTVTFPVLCAAAHVVVLCTGESKRRVVADLFARGRREKSYPIEQVEPERITWLLDEDATAGLGEEARRWMMEG